MASESWDLAAAEKRIAVFSKMHSIPLIQPYQSFIEKADRTRLHFGNVGHLTAEGHTEIAKAVYPQLREALNNF